MSAIDQTSRRLKLQHLNVLVAVAQTGSMAKAARQLALSQPVVSRTIASLEGTLGVRLFDRSPLGVQPTVYGQALLKRGLAIFDDLSASVNELGLLADPTGGELRLGATDAQAGIVASIIERLLQQYPRMTFKVVQAGSAVLIDHELRDRKIELVVGPLPVHSTDQDDLDATVIYHSAPRVLASKQSRWAQRRKINLADLIDEPWCQPWPDSHAASWFARTFRAQGLPVPGSIVTTTSEQLRSRLIADGRFLGMSSDAVLRFNPSQPWLKVLPVEICVPPCAIGIVKLRHRALTPVAERFIKCATAVAAGVMKDLEVDDKLGPPQAPRMSSAKAKAGR
jgi:DNA-binding transcriptional LysR family regulator